jgi:hypothetical protein
MKLQLKSAKEVSYEEGRDLRVVILCEDAATTDKAVDILQFLHRQLEDEAGRLFYQWWNFDFLSVPELGEQFVKQTAAADLIIIGFRARPELPEQFITWLRGLPDLRKQRSGAMIALLDSALADSNSEPEMFSELKHAAALSRLDFFATRAAAGIKPFGQSQPGLQTHPR